MTENAQKVLNQIIKDTAKEAVILDFKEESTDIFDSKIGGKAYLPADADYPVSMSSGQPLVLLCQLNLDKAIHYKNIPEHGMLQFFIAPDGSYGMDGYGDVTQNNFRIVYYENIIYDKSKLKEPPVVAYDPSDMPFSKELKISYKKDMLPISSSDDDYDEIRDRALEEVGIIQLDSNEEVDVENALIDLSGYSGWCDNLRYSQNNPRPEEYPELLLQIDSDCSGKTGIMWGDAGTAHFFITSKNLKEKNFSEVCYQWDCG